METEELLTVESRKILDQICKDSELTNCKLKISSGSAKGDGYASKLFRVAITGTTKTDEEKTLNIILKTAPTGNTYRKSFNCEVLFERELYMYQTVLPEFEKLQKELGVPLEERFKSYCKCYGGSMVHLEEVVVLENIKELGFDLWYRRKPMTFDVVKYVMQTFGRYHALSYSLRERKPEVFKKLTDGAEDVLVPLLSEFNFASMLSKNMEEAQGALDPIKDWEAWTRFGKLLENGWDVCQNLIKESSEGQYSVIGHGDSWSNNMMFKFDGQSAVPKEICLLDWQISRFASPIMDLSYFLMTHLKEFPDRVDELLQEYYKSLSNFLQLLGHEVEKLYPYQEFQRQWKHFCVYGLLWASVLGKVMTVYEEAVPDFVEMSEKDLDMSDGFTGIEGDHAEYQRIMKHAIYYCVDNNFI